MIYKINNAIEICSTWLLYIFSFPLQHFLMELYFDLNTVLGGDSEDFETAISNIITNFVKLDNVKKIAYFMKLVIILKIVI